MIILQNKSKRKKPIWLGAVIICPECRSVLQLEKGDVVIRALYPYYSVTCEACERHIPFRLDGVTVVKHVDKKGWVTVATRRD